MKKGGVVAKVLDCNTVVSEFEYQSHFCVDFGPISLGKARIPLSPYQLIVQLLFFYKNGFAIK